jgi:Isocitrate/isopropylmalate dehydrogenase
LVHIGQNRFAELIHNAWLRTIEDGIHTAEISSPDHTRSTVGTDAFANAIIERLGQIPKTLPAVSYEQSTEPVAFQVQAKKTSAC